MESDRRNGLIERIEQVNLRAVVSGGVGISDCRGASDGIDGDTLRGLANKDADVGAREEREAGIGL